MALVNDGYNTLQETRRDGAQMADSSEKAGQGRHKAATVGPEEIHRDSVPAWGRARLGLLQGPRHLRC